MEKTNHEELVKKINEIIGQHHDWFLSYANKETGDGMTVKSGDYLTISKCMYYSIIANLNAGNSDSAMEMYKIIENVIINLLTNMPDLRQSFEKSLEDAIKQKEQQQQETTYLS